MRLSSNEARREMMEGLEDTFETLPSPAINRDYFGEFKEIINYGKTNRDLKRIN
jgi:hypothetical protein